MFIAIKDTKVIAIHEIEWQCRRIAKDITKGEYWRWLKSVTTEGVPDYSGEDYEIVETNSSVSLFTNTGHIVPNSDGPGLCYHLKWDASKKEVVSDDTAKAAWELAEEWKRIRERRTSLLAQTDYMGNSDVTMPAAWKAYRKSLRDLPAEQSDKTKYSDITWPTKPS
tara:strand:- start:205 stop:705 length:501 start_codon:yes stop_codon:yes gene_type:complete